jgi:hypothetical protein
LPRRAYGILVLQPPATHSTSIATPEPTTSPSSAVTRSQQHPHGGTPPQLASNEANRDCSETFMPIAWTLQQPL